MRIQTLRALIRVHECGSLRAAALQLHTSQPALTLAIRQLESELGCQLLVRTKRGVSLTTFGQALLPRAALIVSESARVQQEIAQLRGDWVGRVRLASSPAMALAVLPQALRPFMAKYPQVQVHCIEGTYPAIAPGLRDGTLDFAVTPFREEDLEPELQAEQLYRSEVVIVANKKHPLARATRLKDLQQARWAYATVTRGPGAVVDEAFREAGLEPPQPVIIFESLLALPEVVASGDLVATVPRRLLGRGEAWDQLCVVPVKDKLPTLNMAVLFRKDQALTPAANELLGWIRQVARG
ncbi:LysR family transcriptional regulator [Ramlibacter sp. AW1]|uniref:LysR family transcriptional regulator n=1 Tax=Ramlibacter aurantiacus TaxID=2801330 RepID=A0A936ZU83_9BURK|nr:LysR family transcriptional regulator [Ramlibacter aurantiacus]MBL0420704.1 LysR family transcriptional regulator [Ramlibacter aurantiacus]